MGEAARVEGDQDEPVLKALGRNIAELRNKLGMTQRVLADASGLGRTRIVEIESGVGPRGVSYMNLVRIADALGVSIHHVIGEGPGSAETDTPKATVKKLRSSWS